MMNCAECQKRIAAYVDAELPPAEMEAVRSHAQTCAGCASSALASLERKLAIRRAGLRYSAPPELRARVFGLCRAKAEVIDRKPVMRSARAWLPQWSIAVAASMLVAAGLFVVANLRQQQRQSLGEFVDLHVATLASANPVEVLSSDRHTVKPWFQRRIPFTFDLPELQGSPFTLVGGRATYFHQEPGAHLVFAYQRHLISTFIFRDTSQLGLPAPPAATREASFNLRSWTQGGLRYVVIGDANAGTIRQLSEQLQHAQ